MISPDQRWIACTKYYPRGTELPASDEYILYDLSKGPSENHVPALSSQYPEGVGKAIYPLGWKNEFADNIGLPESQRHYMVSQFFWSPDSDAVAFGDRLLDELSIVVIKIEKNGTTTALVHPIGDPAWCHPDVVVGTSRSTLAGRAFSALSSVLRRIPTGRYSPILTPLNAIQSRSSFT